MIQLQKHFKGNIMSTIELTKNTKIGFSKLGDFTRKIAVKYPDSEAKRFYHPDSLSLPIEEQIEMIYKRSRKQRLLLR